MFYSDVVFYVAVKKAHCTDTLQLYLVILVFETDGSVNEIVHYNDYKTHYNHSKPISVNLIKTF